ncbi:uncharacterized protein ISCGN_031237 [Ixodes scapularis]
MLSGGNTASATGRVISKSSDDVSNEYKVILPRLPTGNIVLNSVFLHADLTARPYTAPDFRDAIKDVIDLKDVKATGQFQMSHVWMVTCVNALAKEKLCSRGELVVKGKKCLVLDPDTRDLKIKLIWLPDYLEDRRIIEALAPYGTVRNISREKWRCTGMEHMDTLNREVNITLHEGITTERIPFLLKVYGCQSLILIPGRPPLCLRCNRVGHVRRQCRTLRCSECKRYGHTADDCVTTYASKLRGTISQDEEERSELLMDVSEVVDASGHTPSAEAFKSQAEGDLPAAVTDPQTTENDPELLPEPSPPPDDDDDNSSTTTIVGEDATASGDDTTTTFEVAPTTIGLDADALKPQDLSEGLGYQSDTVVADEGAVAKSRKDRKQVGTRHQPYRKQSSHKTLEDGHEGL